MTTSYGMAVASSGFLIPQLENPDIGFGISIILGNTEKTNWVIK